MTENDKTTATAVRNRRQTGSQSTLGGLKTKKLFTALALVCAAAVAALALPAQAWAATPVLSGVSIDNVTANSARLHATSSIMANFYYIRSADMTNTPSSGYIKQNPTNSLMNRMQINNSNSLTLSGLDSDTDYYFYLVAEDASQPGAFSEVYDLTFRTLAAPPVISGASSFDVLEDEVTINFDLAIEGGGAVYAVALPSGASAPNADYIKEHAENDDVPSYMYTDISSGEHSAMQMTIYELTAGTSYIAYLVAENSGGFSTVVPVSFTTTGGADVTPPTVASFTPANGATVPTYGEIEITFDEFIYYQGGGGSVTLNGAPMSGDLVGFTSWSMGQTKYNIAYRSLAPGTVYTVAVSGYKDMAGNTMAPLSFTFTTAGVSGSQPAAVSVTPSGTGAPTSGEIQITFDRSMKATLGTVTLNGSTLTGNTSWPANRNVFNIEYSDLAPGAYTIGISGFVDGAGTVMTLDNTHTFTVGAGASSNATLTSVAGQAITTTGGAGTIANPYTAAITVPNSKTSIVTADLAVATGATGRLDVDGDFTTVSLQRQLAVGNTDVYIEVKAEDATTYRYYVVTVTRPAAAGAPVISGTSADNTTSSTARINFTIDQNVAYHYWVVLPSSDPAPTFADGYAGGEQGGGLSAGAHSITVSGLNMATSYNCYIAVVNGNSEVSETSIGFTTQGAKMATLSDGTVSGTVGTPIAPVDFTVTLTGDTFNGTTWNSTEPTTGLSFELTAANGSTTGNLRVSGTPTAASTTFGLLAYIPGIYITSGSSINVAANNSAKFNIVAAPADVTPPTVVYVTPSTDAPVNGSVSIQFNEAMNIARGTVILNDGVTDITLTGTAGWSMGGKIFNIGYTGLTPSTTYTVKISGFKDTAGNEMSADNSHSFTTAALDNTKPTVTSVTPSGTGVPVNGSVTIRFSEAMNIAGTVILNDGTTDIALTGGGWSFGRTVFEIGYTGLTSGTTYTVRISGFKDGAGNEMLADNSHTFTTAAPADVTPPTVVGVAPSGAGAAVSGSVVVTFSEPMNATPGAVKLGSLPALTGGAWNGAGTVFTIAYSGLAYSTAYTVNISGFKDAAGNAMAANGTHSFTTGNEPVTFVPVTNITGVPTAATVGTALTLTGTVVPGGATNKTVAWSVSPANTLAGVGVAGGKLTATTAGTAKVRATIADGAAVGEDYTQDFDITVNPPADVTPPTVVSVTPSGAGAGVSGNVVVTFSEPMSTAAGAVKLGSLPALTGGAWTSTTVYTIPYSGLAYSTSYTVNISGFRDAAGNTMTAVTGGYTFTTGDAPLTPVTAAAVGGVVAPVAGEAPSTAIDGGTGFTASLSWDGDPATFAYGTAYTATIMLTATDGYTFGGGFGSTAAIAGFTVGGIAPVWVSNNGSALVFKVTFPATDDAPVITIVSQPAAATAFIEGAVSGTLTVEASVTEDAELTYQWFSNTANGNTDGTAIEGATSAGLAIPTALDAGTYYYYVIVSATGAEPVVSTVAVVTVAAAPPVPVFHGLADEYAAGAADVPIRVVGKGSELLTVFKVNGAAATLFKPASAGTYTVEASSADGKLKIWKYVRVK
uniref:Fibronectin type-III domain-containing protein n=1 Tax=termite gut metagenome TaxID=433724 RepID=S0DE05_9ZZZZ